MADEGSTIKIHVLHCGSMLVSKAVPYGGGVNLKNVRRGVFDKLSKRILPGCGFNEKAMLKSFDWIREQANDPGCVAVIASHDPDVRPQVIEL